MLYSKRGHNNEVVSFCGALAPWQTLAGKPNALGTITPLTIQQLFLLTTLSPFKALLTGIVFSLVLN